MRCLKPYRKNKEEIYPCGKCLPCRIQRREDWTLRMMHELQYWKDSCFLTLTYDDAHLPKDGGLSKEDLQLFFKRLRRHLDYKYGRSFKIKYFACGEYGPKGHRPHYHAIIFGLGYNNPEHCKIIMSCWDKCSPWMWRPRWQKGRLRGAIAAVVQQSIRYVAGYVFKKAVDNSIDEWLKRLEDTKGVSLQPVYQTQSQGIGKRFCMDNQSMILRTGKCYQMPVPRYYRKLLNIRHWNNEAFKNICIKQQKFYSAFEALDDPQRRRYALPDTFCRYKDVRGSVKKLKSQMNYYTDIGDEVGLIRTANLIKKMLSSEIIVSNIDYEEQRLHAYSRRYNK